VAKPPTNWRALSGWVLFLGIALIGLAFLTIAFAVASNSGGNAVAETYLTLFGVGIIIIGLSFGIARMG
jgi:hypothetical protein